MEAIAHCHRLGVAHRDIKPDNVLFNEWNELKLADFGSAECFHESELMSGVVGTPYYVAPEVLAGRDYTEKVDVWSAGVILYIMLAGVPPFYGDSAEEIFEAVLRANLRFPARFFNSVSPAAKDLLRRMLCKDVSRRFSAEQVLSKYIYNLHFTLTLHGTSSTIFYYGLENNESIDFETMIYNHKSNFSIWNLTHTEYITLFSFWELVKLRAMRVKETKNLHII